MTNRIYEEVPTGYVVLMRWNDDLASYTGERYNEKHSNLIFWKKEDAEKHAADLTKLVKTATFVVTEYVPIPSGFSGASIELFSKFVTGASND